MTWAGPPPLLLLATVLGVLVAPAVADDGSGRESAPRAVLSADHPPRAVEPHVVRPQRVARQSRAESAPLELAPLDVGVASMNLFRRNSAADAREDVVRLTSRPDVDVIGWQEADPFASAFRNVDGWQTKTFGKGTSNSELAVSWRADAFRLVSARQRVVAPALDRQQGRYPFSSRRVVVVRLEERTSGRVLTVLNTHLPQKIEDLDHAGRWLPTINAGRARAQLGRLASLWQSARADWVVTTGDFNFDAAADARRRPEGGPIRALRARAVSSYQALGRDVGPTHPPTDRNIDYVWADRRAVARGEATFRNHRVLSGFHSDHRPIVVRLRLS